MNQHLQTILSILLENENLTEEQKATITRSVKAVDKELEITAFKLDRTEKVKRTTAILLDETIAELEQKQSAVEAQNRELEIEASLERVRTVAMSMSKQEDMLLVCRIISEQLELLHVQAIRNVQTAIIYEDKGTYSNYEYYAAHNKTLVTEVDYKNHDLQKVFGNQMLKGPEEFFSTNLTGKELKDWYEYQKTTNQFADSFLETATSLNYYWYSIGPVALGISTYKPLNEGEIILFKRFRNVFELAYRRFIDIQKAEAQTRDAQIELALERVRARTMAMQKSDDLAGAVAIIFEELEKLNIGILRCGLGIIKKENKTVNVWTTSISDDNTPVQISGDESMDTHPLLQGAFNAWLKQEDYSYMLQGDDLMHYYRSQEAANFKLPQSQSLINVNEDIQQYYFLATFQAGGLFAFRATPFPDEAKKVMKRFASVFNLTYKRFIDLKTAEAQAREARIEAALERVRGKAMAMHNSNDLSITASMVFTELRKLDIKPIRCGVGLLHKDSRKAQLYSATSSANGDSLSLVGWVELSGHPVLENIYETWLKNEDYFPELTGTQLQSYYQLLLKGLSVSVPEAAGEQKQYGNFLPFSVGYLYAWSNKPYDDAEIKILKRFASIIDLTFRRYIELQRSEANAKEAIKQAALDRIRADIASMRTITDLDRITPLIWNELTIIGIPFIRCGVFIMDDEQEKIHTFLSTPDGKAIAAFHLPYTTPGNIVQILNHWRLKKVYSEHWDEITFTEFANNLVKQGALESSKQYLSTLPAGGFYLHFLPFHQGMLYVGNTTPLSDEELTLIQSVADAFSTAYARYEDFNKLEAAKHQVDKTLVDLKQAQQQLIQSEKMASLGELTAGIAHEIQNPLNFVNNFSEVSAELLEELKEELENKKFEEVKSIADDIKNNLTKIIHHGKRADAIVKGMLQHSRTSNSVKEDTDINTLVDEFARLAFHGLKAKIKNFNACLKTEYDSTIKSIKVIPQDISRVILNLVNNGFYAVHEKKMRFSDGYEPVVFVRTIKTAGSVTIIINDNGTGIPASIIDKVFQPFFTTKPTGEGTGLGLSISYDIIKAHGGDLKVETTEGEGTNFIIQLPIKNN